MISYSDLAINCSVGMKKGINYIDVIISYDVEEFISTDFIVLPKTEIVIYSLSQVRGTRPP